MKKLGALLAFAATFIGGPSLAGQRHIPHTQLEEMFRNIQTQTPWDLSGNMLWGYFFTAPDKEELEKIAAQLVTEGYRLVEIRKLDSINNSYQLHVERVETHSVDSLDKRNSALEEMAGHFTSVIYDGMDVGPAEKSK
ncbi:ribonuclease E inhibitor RraB [Asticcacaulis taihuensis]|uniref:ribonuclease E inhibitor RraB n=1 Tax=Asticcacaulis taihuensis TaxID=260084 RepID=UPI0026E9491C|nr:ribonuclease E inhibitor RraB [Asticcacaulis taihuensis]